MGTVTQDMHNGDSHTGHAQWGQSHRTCTMGTVTQDMDNGDSHTGHAQWGQSHRTCTMGVSHTGHVRTMTTCTGKKLISEALAHLQCWASIGRSKWQVSTYTHMYTHACMHAHTHTPWCQPCRPHHHPTR